MLLQIHALNQLSDRRPIHLLSLVESHRQFIVVRGTLPRNTMTYWALLYFIPTKAQTVFFCSYFMLSPCSSWRDAAVYSYGLEKVACFAPVHSQAPDRKLFPAPTMFIDLKTACFTCLMMSKSELVTLRLNKEKETPKGPQPSSILLCSSHHTLNASVPPHWFMRSPRVALHHI